MHIFILRILRRVDGAKCLLYFFVFFSKITSFIVHFKSNLENWLFYDSFIWISVTMIPNGSIHTQFFVFVFFFETIQPTMTTRHQLTEGIIIIINKLKLGSKRNEKSLLCLVSSHFGHSFGLSCPSRMQNFLIKCLFSLIDWERDEYFFIFLVFFIPPLISVTNSNGQFHLIR